MLAAAVYLAGLYLAKIVVAAFVGHALIGRDDRRLFVTLLVGLGVVFVAINLPFVGTVINVVLTVAGVGILYTQVTGWYRAQGRPIEA